mgnify:CR=1 FL=1
MAEKIVSPGVFTNEIDQSFLPAAAGPVGAAIVGPTVKGPVLEPTIVNSYGEYVRLFGELIQSGSDNYQFLTSHTAKEYLRQGGPVTIVRVAGTDSVRATANVDLSVHPTGSQNTIFTLEALGDGPSFNNFVGTGSEFGTDQLLPPEIDSISNQHFGTGSFGGRNDNFRWEVSNHNTSKGTFTLLIRQGNDTIKKKKIIETHANLSLDPESTDYILKRIGNQTNTIATEDGVAYLQPTGEFPNKSNYVRVSSLPDGRKTPDYLNTNGDVNKPYAGVETTYLPPVGSGSYGGAFGWKSKYPIGAVSSQTPGDLGSAEVEHPYNFYDTISTTQSQGVDLSVSNNAIGTGGYATALSLLSNKDQYNFNLLVIPGIVDQQTDHTPIISQAIQLCEDRGDCFLVFDNTNLTDSVATAKTNTEVRNSSYCAAYYPWIQIIDATTGNYRYVPPSTVIAGVYHFNDVVGQPWFAPAGLNRGGIDSAVQAYKKLTQANRDDLYESNINPIATFPGQGVTVFGQKTTQKKASALDRVNVRRLLINLKTFVASSSRGLLFEQNTSSLRNQFLNVVNPYMEQVQSNSGLNAFRVVMDDSNNTPETIDRNMLVGQIFIQPTKTAEFIVLDFVVQPTGAAFPE